MRSRALFPEPVGLPHEGSGQKRSPNVDARYLRQVFGLTGAATSRVAFLLIAASRGTRCVPVLCGDGRSRLPLRGSPGFQPGSLFSRPTCVGKHRMRGSGLHRRAGGRQAEGSAVQSCPRRARRDIWLPPERGCPSGGCGTRCRPRLARGTRARAGTSDSPRRLQGTRARALADGSQWAIRAVPDWCLGRPERRAAPREGRSLGAGCGLARAGRFMGAPRGRSWGSCARPLGTRRSRYGSMMCASRGRADRRQARADARLGLAEGPLARADRRS